MIRNEDKIERSTNITENSQLNMAQRDHWGKKCAHELLYLRPYNMYTSWGIETFARART